MDTPTQNIETNSADSEASRQEAEMNSITNNSVETINFKTPSQCDSHRNSDLEYFCPAHNKVVCEVCLKISHRTCPHIQKLGDASLGVASTDEYQRIREDLDSLERDYDKNVEVIADATRNMDNTYNETLLEVKRILNHVYEADKMNLEAITSTSNQIRDEVQALKRELDNGSDTYKFLTLKRATDEVANFREGLVSARKDARISRYGILSFTTKSGNPVDRFVGENYVQEAESAQAFSCWCPVPNPGQIEGQVIKDRNPCAPHRYGGNQVIGQICTFPRQLEKIDIETQSDRHHCSVSGLALLTDGRLVVVDNRNQKVKLFAMETRSLLAELSMEAFPLAVTRIDEENIVMSSATDRRGYLISFNGDQIRIERHFEFEGTSQNIGYNNGRYIVAFSDTPKIQMLDQRGQVTKTIKSSSQTADRDTIHHMTTSFIPESGKAEFFLQGNCGENKVSRMNLDGDVISEFEAVDMKYPIDFAHVKDGSVYVCCKGSDNVFKLSRDLSMGHVILDEKNGLVSPWCLALCNDKNMLYIGSYGSKYVQAFRI